MGGFETRIVFQLFCVDFLVVFYLLDFTHCCKSLIFVTKFDFGRNLKNWTFELRPKTKEKYEFSDKKNQDFDFRIQVENIEI